MHLFRRMYRYSHQKRIKGFLCLIVYVFVKQYSFNAQVIIYDRLASPKANAKMIMSFNSKVFKNVDTLLYKEKINSVTGVLGRIAKTLMFDYQVIFVEHSLLHEVFGHGYRYREFDFLNSSYKISPLPPFGSGDAFASRGRSSRNVITDQEEILMMLGGVESSQVSSSLIMKNWFLDGDLIYYDNLMYISTYNDISANVIGSKLLDLERGDIERYISLINRSYGLIEESNYRFTINDAYIGALYNILNPTNIFAFYSFFNNYLIKGVKRTENPKIRIGRFNFWPDISYSLTPFGGQYSIEFFHFRTDFWRSVKLSVGDNKLESYWKFSYEQVYRSKINSKEHFGFRTAIFASPPLALGGENVRNIRGRLGGIGVLKFRKRLNSSRFFLVGEIGYKTTGFEKSEIFDQGGIFRFGVEML